jgi:hypothetical protein
MSDTNNSKGNELEKSFTLGDVVDSAIDPEEGGLLPVEGPAPIKELLKKTLDGEYPKLKMTHKQAKRVAKYIGHLRLGGPAGVPLICLGDSCDFNDACPLYQEKTGNKVSLRDATGQITTIQETLAPVGQPCPLESTYILDMRMRLETDLASELSEVPGVLKNHYINEICQIAMLEWRANMKLSVINHDVVQPVPGAVTPDGQVIWKNELSPLIELLERLSARRSKIYTELVATPKEKYKREQAVGKAQDDSLSRIQSAQRQMLKEKMGNALPGSMSPNPGKKPNKDSE